MALPSADMSGLPGIPDMPINIPPPQAGGMFGSGNPLGEALMAAIAGFNARRNPQFSSSIMEGLNQRQTLSRQAQLAMLQSNLEFQRQLQLMPYQMQMKMYDNPLAQTLLAQGIKPGDPQWNQAFSTQQTNTLDPVVNAGLYGPVLRSQVSGAAGAQPPAAPVGKLTPITDGGPTPSASGGFF